MGQTARFISISPMTFTRRLVAAVVAAVMLGAPLVAVAHLASHGHADSDDDHCPHAAHDPAHAHADTTPIAPQRGEDGSPGERASDRCRLCELALASRAWSCEPPPVMPPLPTPRPGEQPVVTSQAVVFDSALCLPESTGPPQRG